ncbi:MAG TPA: toprim domain-containing protein [Mycobacterium sp.]|nr:toprim domain-containing protein [Mycobacterium sp.]
MSSADPEVLREVTRAAAAIFSDPIRRRAALSYLHQRGIDATTLPPEWLLGYVPPGWTRLVDKLRHRFPDQALLDAGVARLSSRGTLIDSFRNRVIFGIRDTDGAVAGFIGRDLSGHPGAPKYLNTHQHPLFDKGSLLYGLYEGMRDGHARQPVVVEGPLDVLAIAARQHTDAHAGLVPVAACGTSFTVSHARRAAAVAFAHQSPVVVAMDSDPAGRAAALSAGERLRAEGLEVRLATLPDGSDPAEHLAHAGGGLDAFQADDGLPLINLQVQHAIARQGDRMQWVEGRLAALRSLTDYLATYPSSYTARQIGWLAEALALTPSSVTAELADAYLHRDRKIGTRERQRAMTVDTGAHIAI